MPILYINLSCRLTFLVWLWMNRSQVAQNRSYDGLISKMARNISVFADFEMSEIRIFLKNSYTTYTRLTMTHCVKNVQIRSFFWSVFSRFRTEDVKIRTRKNSVSGHFSHSDNLRKNFHSWRQFHFSLTPANIRKPLMFSGRRKRVYWERMGFNTDWNSAFKLWRGKHDRQKVLLHI